MPAANEPQYLYGLHDPGGESHMAEAPGWVVVTEELHAGVRSEAAAELAELTRRGVGLIVRLNWGYGAVGTIPPADLFDQFAARCAEYVTAVGTVCRRWVVGNEPNHSQERPNGERIEWAAYVECLRRVRKAIRGLPGHERDEVIPAAVAPWNVETGDWLDYWRSILAALGPDGCEALALHTYTHGVYPGLITAETRMTAPYHGRLFEFRAYRDLLAVVPANMRHLPVYITETDQNERWADQNSGWVQAAYYEIDQWNQRPGSQKIHALVLYRWKAFDQWGIEQKSGVIQDFRAAVARRYGRPGMGPTASTIYLPKLDLTKRLWDMRLSERGVKVETPATSPRWAVTVGRWLDEQEAEGRHHIYVDVVDEAGQRLPGIQLRVTWPGGSHVITTESAPGEVAAANYPMSPSRNEFAIAVVDEASEMVTGLGMGAQTAEGFNPGIHTSTFLRFQRRVASAQSPLPVPAPDAPRDGSVGEPRAQVPPLAHPVAHAGYRVVTQPFGVWPEYYRQFAVDGVALRGHNGIDFGTPVGTPIVAVDAGSVVEVAEDPGGYGRYVKVAHAWGESLYGHLKEQVVQVGDTVQMGLIGFSGNTGKSTGPHLHFGLRVEPFNRQDGWGGYTDPAPYLRNAVTAQGDIPTLIRAAAGEFGVPESLLASLIWGESSFRINARSEAGALGLGQLMPATWAEWSAKVGVKDPWDAQSNLRVSAAYLAWLLYQVGGDRRKALIAYNWGIGLVLAGKRKPPAETIAFADRVIHGADLLDHVVDA